MISRLYRSRIAKLPAIVLGILALVSLLGCDKGPSSTEGLSDAEMDALPSGNVELATPRTQTATASQPAPSATGEAREIEWDNLIPDDYRPDLLLAEYDIDDITDDDPRAADLMDKIRALWDEAPVRNELDGEHIKLPGFIVPVESDENETTGFLLVPYYGACIHVPPPPANQTVYVVSETGEGPAPGLFDVVWVTGMMSVNRIENDIAEAGYTIYASEVAPYEEPL
jgi:hypothetical protein